MRPALRHNKLIAPSTLSGALDRIEQLKHEISKIDAQLRNNKADDTVRYRTPEAYWRWRESAQTARRNFVLEAGFLGAYIDGWKAALKTGEPLFREAYETLKDLELEVDFEDEEQALMEKLDDHFAPNVATGRKH